MGPWAEPKTPRLEGEDSDDSSLGSEADPSDFFDEEDKKGMGIKITPVLEPVPSRYEMEVQPPPPVMKGLPPSAAMDSEEQALDDSLQDAKAKISSTKHAYGQNMNILNEKRAKAEEACKENEKLKAMLEKMRKEKELNDTKIDHVEAMNEAYFKQMTDWNDRMLVAGEKHGQEAIALYEAQRKLTIKKTVLMDKSLEIKYGSGEPIRGMRPSWGDEKKRLEMASIVTPPLETVEDGHVNAAMRKQETADVYAVGAKLQGASKGPGAWGSTKKKILLKGKYGLLSEEVSHVTPIKNQGRVGNGGPPPPPPPQSTPTRTPTGRPLPPPPPPPPPQSTPPRTPTSAQGHPQNHRSADEDENKDGSLELIRAARERKEKGKFAWGSVKKHMQDLELPRWDTGEAEKRMESLLKEKNKPKEEVVVEKEYKKPTDVLSSDGTTLRSIICLPPAPANQKRNSLRPVAIVRLSIESLEWERPPIGKPQYPKNTIIGVGWYGVSASPTKLRSPDGPLIAEFPVFERISNLFTYLEGTASELKLSIRNADNLDVKGYVRVNLGERGDDPLSPLSGVFSIQEHDEEPPIGRVTLSFLIDDEADTLSKIKKNIKGEEEIGSPNPGAAIFEKLASKVEGRKGNVISTDSQALSHRSNPGMPLSARSGVPSGVSSEAPRSARSIASVTSVESIGSIPGMRTEKLTAAQRRKLRKESETAVPDNGGRVEYGDDPEENLMLWTTSITNPEELPPPKSEFEYHVPGSRGASHSNSGSRPPSQRSQPSAESANSKGAAAKVPNLAWRPRGV